MKKILLFLIVIFLYFFAAKDSSAQIDPSICDPVNGCVRCTYNQSDDTCHFDSQNPIPGATCSGGATPPTNMESECRTHDNDPAACQSDYRSCESPTVEGGGFYCLVDGPVRTCNSCDNNSNTLIPDCPNSGEIYTTAALCVSACIIPDDNYDCVQSGGICQNSCGAKQEAINGATCEPGRGLDVCCKGIKDLYLCTRQTDQETGIDTAIGCIPFAQPESIAAFAIRWGVRIGGGIAMLIFLAAGFQFITSSGDPEKVNSAKELFLAGIAGLIMIIFSVFLLRLIGFDILEIFR